MMTEIYLIIENNVVSNIVLWDGDTQNWTPPLNAIALAKSTTPAISWVLDNTTNTYVLTRGVGSGDMGFTWDGTVLTTSEPQPSPPAVPTTPKASANQPTTTGTTPA